MTEKNYCYVDESGQDTQGKLFIVAVVVIGQARDQLRLICEEIEKRSQKRHLKWIETNHKRQISYVQGILETPIFKETLYFALYQSTKAYSALTVQTIAKVLKRTTAYQATVFIDGLPRSQEQRVGLQLRRLGVRVKKVRGVKDENEVLIRLADATCGFVREAMEGEPAMLKLFKQGIQQGFLQDLSPQ